MRIVETTKVVYVLSYKLVSTLELPLFSFFKHVSGLFISLWEPANSLFVRDKYVTPTGKRLHAGYIQKAEARKKHTI